MNTRFKNSSMRANPIKTNGLPLINLSSEQKHALQLKNSFIFQRLKETPTFHLIKPGQNPQGPSKPNKSTQKAPHFNKTMDFLKLCNKEKLDKEIEEKTFGQTSGDWKNTEMQKKLEKQLFYFGKGRIIIRKKEKNQEKNKASLLYERFFNRPNLNEIVNLSDLLRKQKEFRDFTEMNRYQKVPKYEFKEERDHNH